MVGGASSFYIWYLAQIYLYRIQESPTLDLANDRFRFITGHFEIISASSPHIYHSALVVAPKNSVVRKLCESHAHPFARVIYGAAMLWDGICAATTLPSELEVAVRSPCDRFIAVTLRGARTVDILDSKTPQRLQTLEPPQVVSIDHRGCVFSPDSRILTCYSGDPLTDPQDFVVSWDLQWYSRLSNPRTFDDHHATRFHYPCERD